MSWVGYFIFNIYRYRLGQKKYLKGRILGRFILLLGGFQCVLSCHISKFWMVDVDIDAICILLPEFIGCVLWKER